MKLSENFYLSEFTQSQTATRMGRTIEPDHHQIVNLEMLCLDLLQPIRDRLTQSVDPKIRMHISSGLRPSWLNKAIGGSKTSAHVYGRAADWGISGMAKSFDLYDVCKVIAQLDLPFDQLIYEGGRWIHIGAATLPRREILTATFSRNRWGQRKTHYRHGLIRVA